MNFHDALDRLNGPHLKDDRRKLIEAFIAVGGDRRSRLVRAEVDGEPRVFRVAKKLSEKKWRGHFSAPVIKSGPIRVSLIPKQRQNSAYADYTV